MSDNPTHESPQSGPPPRPGEGGPEGGQAGGAGVEAGGRPCRACGEPNDRYLNTAGKLCSRCRARKMALAATEPVSKMDSLRADLRGMLRRREAERQEVAAAKLKLARARTYSPGDDLEAVAKARGAVETCTRCYACGREQEIAGPLRRCDDQLLCVACRPAGGAGVEAGGRPCRACGEPNDRYLNTAGKLCSRCRARKMALAAARSPVCGACGAPVVDNRCTRDPDECWKRSQMKRNLNAAEMAAWPQTMRQLADEGPPRGEPVHIAGQTPEAS